VAAVSAAGGFGFLGMVREPPDFIRSEIARVRAATTRDFGVNLIPAATDPDLLKAELDVVIAERVAAVTLFWDLRPDIVCQLRDSGCLVLCQVGSFREAKDAEAAGAHIVIAQGLEAGGPVRGTTNLADLVPDVVARVDVPLLAAGGIVDGSGLAAALRWGAQGAVIGTGFLATQESFAHDYHERRIVDTGPLAELLRTIQRDEARWCAMLHRHVKALGGKPSPNIGAFYGKAMAVTDLRERIAFLNRGQSWVVRKLREMLPRIRNDRLHADLSEMLRSHEVNIVLANEVGK
jgi:hypothetical protein